MSDKAKMKQDYADLKQMGTSDEDIAETLNFKSVGDMLIHLEIEPNRKIEQELPVYMRKGSHPLLVGTAVVQTTVGDNTTIVVSLDTPEGREMGSLLSSKLVSGVSIGGIMDAKTMEQLKK